MLNNVTNAIPARRTVSSKRIGVVSRTRPQDVWRLYVAEPIAAFEASLVRCKRRTRAGFVPTIAVGHPSTQSNEAGAARNRDIQRIARDDEVRNARLDVHFCRMLVGTAAMDMGHCYRLVVR